MIENGTNRRGGGFKQWPVLLSAAILGCSETENAADADISVGPRNSYHAEFNMNMDESGAREQIKSALNLYLVSEDYEKLEAIAEHYSGDQRTFSGLFKSTMFYGAYHAQHGFDTRGVTDEFSKQLASWEEAYPDSPAPKLFRAIAMRDSAEAYLASRTLAKGEFEIFLTKIRTAGDYFESIWDDVKHLPYAHAVRLHYAFFHPEMSRKWFEYFEESREQFPGYYQIYFAVIDTAAPYTPDNNNLAFIDSVAEALVEDTPSEGQAGYARVYWAAMGRTAVYEFMRRRYVNWNKMERGFIDILEQYPDPWNANAYVRFSCINQDRKTVRNILPLLENKHDDRIWSLESRDACERWASFQGENPYAPESQS